MYAIIAVGMGVLWGGLVALVGGSWQVCVGVGAGAMIVAWFVLAMCASAHRQEEE